MLRIRKSAVWVVLVGFGMLVALFSGDVRAEVNPYREMLYEGYRMNVKVNKIYYRYLDSGEAKYTKREVDAFDATITMTKSGEPAQIFNETIMVGEGGHVIDSLPIPLSKAEASYIFHKDERVLANHFTEITSSSVEFDAAGRPANMHVKGIAENAFGEDISNQRTNMTYDSQNRLYSYLSLFSVCRDDPDFPICNVDAYRISKIYYNADNRPSIVVFNLHYGPSNTWLLYYLKYDQDGEIREYNLGRLGS